MFELYLKCAIQKKSISFLCKTIFYNILHQNQNELDDPSDFPLWSKSSQLSLLDK